MDHLSAKRTTASERAPRLSICISTLNRAEFLRTTLEKIVPELTDECDVLVLDNASVDHTKDVVADQMQCSERVRYIRKETNEGMDGNYDRAVELARGEYCWLMSDDDVIKTGSIAAVLNALRGDPSVVLVNYEFRDFTLSKVLHARAFPFETDRIYGPWEADRVFVELGECMRFIGAHVMKRSMWLSRERERYIGSCYGFIGMIFQAPLPRHVHVIAEPCVAYRIGNETTFSSHLMELMLAKWPSLVASLPLQESSKNQLSSAQPWKHFYELLRWRARGYYSYEQYRRWLHPRLRRVRDRLLPVFCARVPPALASWMITTYLSVRRNSLRDLRGFHLAMIRARRPHRRRNQEPRMQHESKALLSTNTAR